MDETGLILRCSCDVSTKMRAMGVLALVSKMVALIWRLALMLTVREGSNLLGTTTLVTSWRIEPVALCLQ